MRFNRLLSSSLAAMAMAMALVLAVASLAHARGMVSIQGSVVNMRSAPGTSSRIVGKAERGDVLRTLQTQGNWVKVHSADQGPTGWVARSLLWGW